MIEQQALEVKDLAKPCNEALGVITGGRFCRCYKDGNKPPILTDFRKTNICQMCLKPIGVGAWTWNPQVGETVYYRSSFYDLFQIVSVGETRVTLLPFDIPYLGESLDDYVYAPEIIDVIPILEWEEIERVLHENDYSTHMEDLTVEGSYAYEFEIHQEFDSDSFPMGKGKSRTRAVYKAVIALGKKLGEEINAK